MATESDEELEAIELSAENSCRICYTPLKNGSENNNDLKKEDELIEKLPCGVINTFFSIPRFIAINLLQ